MTRSFEKLRPSEPSGFTLIELLVAVAVSSLVFLFAGTAIYNLTDFTAKTRMAVMSNSEQRIFQSQVQKRLPRSAYNIRAFAHDSHVAGARPKTVRFLTPLPGRCADFSQTCADDTALLFAGPRNRSMLPAVNAICLLSSGGSDQVVLDFKQERLPYPASGNASVGGSGILTPAATTVGLPAAFEGMGAYQELAAAGQIDLSANKIVALASGDSAQLWRALGPPAALTAGALGWNAGTGTYGNTNFERNCRMKLARKPSFPPPAGSPYQDDFLYTINLSPVTLRHLFSAGPPIPSGADREAAYPSFPMRLFNVNIYSIGRDPTMTATPIPPFNVRQQNLVFLLCNDTVGGAPFTCPFANRIAQVPGLRVTTGAGTPGVRVLERFAPTCHPSANCGLFRDIVGPGQGAFTAACQSASLPNTICGANTMSLGSFPATIPTVIGSENLTNLDLANFSMVKQDALSVLRILYQYEKTPNGSLPFDQQPSRSFGVIDVINN